MSIINFTVSVPINTPEEDTIYITGNHDVLNNWEPPGLPLEKTGEKEYNIELDLPEGSEIEFKFTRGTWPSVEGDEDFQEAGSRVYTVDSDEDVYLTVANWVDLVDIEKENTLTGNFRIHRDFFSESLNDTRTIMVYLPPGYAYEEEHYPVLYLHDGQNVFDATTSYCGVEWRVDETAETLIEEGKIRKIIIVGIYNNKDRDDEYTHTYDPSEGTGGKVEYYANFIINELKPFIDSNYRTSSEDTGIMGSSLGGLCSLYMGWKYPDVFSNAGVISPSLWWNDRDILHAIKEDEDFDGPDKIWLDIGTEEGEDEDNDNISESVENTRCLGELLLEKGYILNENLFYFEDEGADHSESAWSNRVGQILLTFYGI
ncbi:MAG TPA: alpha/beta hydrolase-fold protein [Candidatus Eremiobacteraeota bacterium]|nr:alpha/beta hydrolase-fold protein [Candidatus Eremiobacteraeota bacterium]